MDTTTQRKQAKALLQLSNLIHNHSCYSDEVRAFYEANKDILGDIESLLGFYKNATSPKPVARYSAADYGCTSRYNSADYVPRYFTEEKHDRDNRDREMERIEDSRGVSRWG